MRVSVAALQLNSGPDPERNFARLEALSERAAGRGARLVVAPENVLYEGDDPRAHHRLEEWGPRLAGLAERLGVSLVAGSIRVPAGDPTAEGFRTYNTSLVYGPDGAELARYRKIHLFDVEVPGGAVERESDYYAPGEEVVSCEVPGVGSVGLAICYDVRFPELFRVLRERGVGVVVLPSAFALGTGKDHWAPLVRARAIENQVFVIAPDQFGAKGGGRVRYGKSMIVDPWGQVLGQAREADEDVVVCELDFEDMERIRRILPSWSHRRLT